MVETRRDAASAWTPCYLGTRRRVTRFFRIYAMRRDLMSLPSAPVVIYASPNSAAASGK